MEQIFFPRKVAYFPYNAGLISFFKIFAHKNENLSLNEYLFLIYMISDQNLILNFLVYKSWS